MREIKSGREKEGEKIQESVKAFDLKTKTPTRTTKLTRRKLSASSGTSSSSSVCAAGNRFNDDCVAISFSAAEKQVSNG